MGLGLILLLAAGCSGKGQLNLLEQETTRFKAENKRVRAASLEAEFERNRRRADTLSEQVLAVGRERDRLYRQYDDLRSELSRSSHQLAEGRKRKVAVETSLRKLQADLKKLHQQLETERKAGDTLQKQLEAATARRRALEAAGAGAKAPE